MINTRTFTDCASIVTKIYTNMKKGVLPALLLTMSPGSTQTFTNLDTLNVYRVQDFHFGITFMHL